MQHRLSSLVLSLIASVVFFSTSCKKEFSKDEPLPDVFTPTIFISSQNGFVYALEPGTGKKKWEFNANSNVQASPMILGEDLFITAENGVISKLDAKRGTLRQQITFPGQAQILCTPLAERKGWHDHDFFYVGTANDSLYCYDLTSDGIFWSFGTGAQIISSPTSFDTTVIVASYDGKVRAISKVFGNQKWEFSAPTGAPFYSSPIVSGGILYIGSYDGTLYTMDAYNGNPLWSFPTGGPILSSPIVYGGNCIFGSNDYNLYCLDIATGLPRWVFPTNDRIVSSPYAFNQVIYVGSYDYNVYAVNIIDGSIKWQYKTGAIVKSSPLYYNNMIYAGSYDKNFYALNPETGKPNWKSNINGLIECSPLVDSLDGSSYRTSAISGNSPQ